jgi:hypothetical protein
MNQEDFAGKNLVELLDMLEPVPEPAEISMWPQTEGWIWLGAAILVLLVLIVRRWVSWRRANAYRRAALSELKRADDDPVVVANILRRTALADYPREQVAGLTGDNWLRFLDGKASGSRFLSEKGKAMAAAPYRGDVAPVHGLSAMAETWVRKHKADAT